MKKYKNKIITAVIILVMLAVSFWYGSDVPKSSDKSFVKPDSVTLVSDNNLPPKTQKAEALEEDKPERIDKDEEKVAEIISDDTDISLKEESKTKDELSKDNIKNPSPAEIITDDTNNNSMENTGEVETTPVYEETTFKTTVDEIQKPVADSSERKVFVQNGMVLNGEVENGEFNTQPIPDGMPLPIEPQNAVISDKELSCTLVVRCDTILNNIGHLNKDKVNLVPEDGMIFCEKTVTFYEGESVFNILVREMKRNKIHLEFVNTPIYNSAYIEGIGNIYEFDCGELSGWIYRVNGWVPNYGCSRYQLKEGDRVEWLYTCDLGRDVR